MIYVVLTVVFVLLAICFPLAVAANRRSRATAGRLVGCLEREIASLQELTKAHEREIAAKDGLIATLEGQVSMMSARRA